MSNIFEFFGVTPASDHFTPLLSALLLKGNSLWNSTNGAGATVQNTWIQQNTPKYTFSRVWRRTSGRKGWPRKAAVHIT